jgi:WD40 repeat protein
VLRGHSGRIDRLIFSPDGRSLVSAGDDRLAIVWDLVSRMPLRTFPSESEVPSHLQFSRDGQRLVSASSTESAVIITDIANAAMQRIAQPECQPMLSLAADGNADRLALGCADLILRVVRTNGGRTQNLRGTTGVFTSCAFSPDGTLLAAGSERGTVYVWELSATSAEPAQRYQSQDLAGRVAAIAFTPDGHRLTAVAADGRAMMWRVADDPAAANDQAPAAVSFVAGAGGSELAATAFDPTGARLVCLAGQTLMLWDLSVMPPVLLASPMVMKESLSAAAVDPTGRWWAGAAANGEIQVNPVPSIQLQPERPHP